MDRKGNFTLAFDNQLTGEMIKTFMACQVCKHVNTKNKLLKCTHTICQKCALTIRRRQKKTGHWTIECLICKIVTYCYGDSMEGLKENVTVQKLVEKASTKRNYSPSSSRYGNMPAPSDDVYINIVSSVKEKQEIQKVLESAQRRVLVCQDQAKQVKSYEKKVKAAKSKVENQIKESVEAFILAIRTQEDQLLRELERMFQEEFHPVKEANECIDMQMQSFKLVKQCCSVAGRILKGGGAPVDMDSFKQMVRQSMEKMNGQELPTAIQKTYKPKVFFTSNEVEYDDMAERIGKLSLRKERRKESKKYSRNEEMRQPQFLNDEEKEEKRLINSEQFVMKEAASIETQDVEDDYLRKKIEEEPIYDLPPDWESVQHEAQKNRYGYEEDHDEREEQECYYDVIPFSYKSPEEVENDHDIEQYDSDESVPEPIEKDYVTHKTSYNQSEQEVAAPITGDELAMITHRRQAVGGSDTEWEDMQSADELDEN